MPNSPYSQSLSLSQYKAPVVKQDADLKPVAPAKIRSVKCVNCCYLIVAQQKTKSVDRFYESCPTLYSLDSATLLNLLKQYMDAREFILPVMKKHCSTVDVIQNLAIFPVRHFGVITNSNTERKRTMVQSIMQDMQFLPMRLIKCVELSKHYC